MSALNSASSPLRGHNRTDFICLTRKDFVLERPFKASVQESYGKKLVHSSFVTGIFCETSVNMQCMIIPPRPSHPNLASLLRINNTAFLVITVKNTDWEEPIFEFTSIRSQESLSAGKRRKKKCLSMFLNQQKGSSCQPAGIQNLDEL